MGKLLLALIFVLILAASAFADGSYEAKTIDNTSGGVALTAATYGSARAALCRLETGPIRFTKDGSTAPTADVGIPLYPLEWIILENQGEIRNFRGFRTTATSGSLKCFYLP